jgi:hypothetical protein
MKNHWIKQNEAKAPIGVSVVEVSRDPTSKVTKITLMFGSATGKTKVLERLAKTIAETPTFQAWINGE